MPRLSMAPSHIGRLRSRRLNLRWRPGRLLSRSSSAPAAGLDLSQYLHDEVGQWLALAMLQLDSIRPPTSIVEDALCRLRNSLEQASLAIRDATHLLGAPMDAPTLLAAIEQSLNSSPWADRPLATRLSPALTELEQGRAPLAPRIIRELVGNAHRHAHATRIELHAWCRSAILHIRVKDNGVGLHDMDRSSGYGLDSVRRQVAQESGRLHFDTRVGHGTWIEVELPLRRIDHATANDSPRSMKGRP
jgi:two-component system, NarL family, sensor histidine kinase FusK